MEALLLLLLPCTHVFVFDSVISPDVLAVPFLSFCLWITMLSRLTCICVAIECYLLSWHSIIFCGCFGMFAAWLTAILGLEEILTCIIVVMSFLSCKQPLHTCIPLSFWLHWELNIVSVVCPPCFSKFQHYDLSVCVILVFLFYLYFPYLHFFGLRLITAASQLYLSPAQSNIVVFWSTDLVSNLCALEQCCVAYW